MAERRGCEQGVDRSALRSDTDAGATSRSADRAPLQRDGLVYGEDAVTEGRAQVAQPRIDAILSRSCVKEIRPLFDLAYREHRQPERVITHSLEPREDRGVRRRLRELGDHTGVEQNHGSATSARSPLSRDRSIPSSGAERRNDFRLGTGPTTRRQVAVNPAAPYRRAAFKRAASAHAFWASALRPCALYRSPCNAYKLAR